MPIHISISGAGRVARSVENSAKRIAEAVHRRAEARADGWLEVLKAAIQHVVYDAYNPETYRRNLNLLKAASLDGPQQFLGLGGRGTTLRLFNDSSKIQYRPDATGHIGPRGGSQPHEVPWEIETGNYPQPWHGFTAPRPAYLLTADAIRPEAEALADEAVAEGIRK